MRNALGIKETAKIGSEEAVKKAIELLNFYEVTPEDLAKGTKEERLVTDKSVIASLHVPIETDFDFSGEGETVYMIFYAREEFAAIVTAFHNGDLCSKGYADALAFMEADDINNCYDLNEPSAIVSGSFLYHA